MSEEREGPITRLPLWRIAVQEILGLKPKPGEIIPRSYMWEALEMGNLDEMRGKDAVTTQNRFNAAMDEVRKCLLIEHNMLLRYRAAACGYEIVPPAEQADYVFDGVQRQLVSALKGAERKMNHIDFVALSDEQRRNVFDRRARLGGFMQAVGRQLFEPAKRLELPDGDKGL